MNKIEEKYDFADFTLESYRRKLRLALARGLRFNLFNTETIQSGIYLRHDVEFSPALALELAKIENSLGIRSTYFIQLHSDFYNALEPNNFQILNIIRSLGHELALHFDSHFWGIENENELEDKLAKDFEVLNGYFGNLQNVFSFHNTNSFTLSCKQETYAGLINVYSDRFTNHRYCADSTGFWRYEKLDDVIQGMATNETLQLLIHDTMWQREIMSPRDRVFSAVDEQSILLKSNYDQTLKEFGAKNITKDGEL